MNIDDTRQDVAQEVERLDKALTAEQASRKGVTRAAQAVAAVLGCTVLFFILVNFVHLRSHWTEENLKRSLEKELTELSPLAIKELNAAGKELLPVYAQEGQKQVQLLMPEIARVMRRELDKFCEEMLLHTHAQLAESHKGILANTEKSLFEQFPELKNSATRKKMEQNFEKITQKAVQSALVEFDRLFTSDIENVKSALLKFDLKDSSESTVDLQKNFLRLWLQLLDEEIKEL